MLGLYINLSAALINLRSSPGHGEISFRANSPLVQRTNDPLHSAHNQEQGTTRNAIALPQPPWQQSLLRSFTTWVYGIVTSLPFRPQATTVK
eukprot:720045-Amphidinium_carterae.1